MKIFLKPSLFFILIFFAGIVRGQNNLWTDVPERSLQTGGIKRTLVPEKARTVALDKQGMLQFLQAVPREFSSAALENKHIMQVPMPYGGYQNFSVVEMSLMEPGLDKELPEVKTYRGQGIDDPSATIVMDVSSFGFHAMILSPVNGTVYIDPYTRNRGDDGGHLVYYKKDFKSDRSFTETDWLSPESKPRGAGIDNVQASSCIGGTLKTYRLAIACTGEYAAAVGATTKQQALNAIITTINRVSGVYEKELGIRFTLVASQLKIIFVNAATDPFTGNDNANTLIGESQQVITDSILSANFDIGHTFSTGGGGLASPGVVCRNSQKASGITGLSAPFGDPYDIDYVSHEIGHQFGANHTFNGNTGNCLNNVALTSNVEPGSGSTIMAYAGICGSNNLQNNTDPQFHAISLNQINAYITSGSGNTCGTATATGNLIPVVNAGADYIVPKSTPLMVTGSATDGNGDGLVYSWEQVDFGGTPGNAASPVGQAPLFRSFSPVTSPVRIFPRVSDLVNNTNTIGEVLPSYARTVNLRLTARDNRSGGGGVCSDDMEITVDANTGPFLVTSPDTAQTWIVNSFKTITWNVGNTINNPVNCANVSISLSVDGGFTFPIILVASTPNDGSEEVVVPANITTQARIRVMAVGNIFFDISNANFAIQNATVPEFVYSSPALTVECGGSSASVVLKSRSLAGFSTPINLSASGNPQGTNVSFSANPLTPGNDVTVTLSGPFTQDRYTITVTGTAGSITKTQTLQFVVRTLNAQSTLSQPANNSTAQSLTPTFVWSSVPGATSYNFQLSASPVFASLITEENNLTDTKYTAPPLAENTSFYWRVYANNQCGRGSSSPSFTFKTVGQLCGDTLKSTDVPKTISPVGAVTVVSNLVVAKNVVISDVNVVGLKGTHSYLGDIEISLTSPANTTVVLVDRLCDNEQNFDMNLDDEVVENIACPPVNGGTFKPENALSAFDGESSAGTWLLTVKDYSNEDGGSLNGWGLRICTNSDNSLPVSWLTFTAHKQQAGTVLLQWTTANEVANKQYNIERSSDGISFYTIGDMPPGTNASSMQQYFYTDMRPAAGTNYYRLKQTDIDGRFSFSSIAKVEFENVGASWSVYPNPASGSANIRILKNAGKAVITLSDVSGKIVYSQNLSSVKAGQQITLPLHNAAPGFYILKLKTETESRSEKLIIQ